MRIETQRKILALSQRIISEWYKGRTDELIPLLDDKAMWIGAAASQFYRGRTEVAAALKKVSEDIPPCTVSEEMWFLEECGSDWGAMHRKMDMHCYERKPLSSAAAKSNLSLANRREGS